MKTKPRYKIGESVEHLGYQRKIRAIYKIGGRYEYALEGLKLLVKEKSL